MTPIDFKVPTYRLNEVLYEVGLQPVYFGYIFPDEKAPQLSGNNLYRAVVNQDSGKLVSVVSRNYKLITNREALEMGKEIFVQLMPGLKKDELIPYKIIAPRSLASVHIDLIHQNVNFSILVQETWLPFLRVTNSYNRSQALAFEVGFVKKLCSNGVLFNKKSMKLKYMHDKHHQIRVKSDAGEIFSFFNLFGLQCESLCKFKIPTENMFPLLCHILKINLEIPEERKIREKINQLNKLCSLVQEQTESYGKYLGLNAYTAFNIAADLVSHNDRYNILPGYYFNTRSFFTRPADWMDEFFEETGRPGFTMETCLAPITAKLNEWKKIWGFNWN